jgi:hypothetical protein
MSEEELDKVLSSLQLEDLRWRWSDKCSALKGDEYEWFFLYALDKPQGACVVYHPKDSELQGGKIFYVEYLAVAPWNRKSLMRTREYRSVGSILLRTVLKFCVDNLGLSPGFSLHSLPQASGYYKKLNMVNICSLDKDLLVYFELPPVEARKLLSVA